MMSGLQSIIGGIWKIVSRSCLYRLICYLQLYQTKSMPTYYCIVERLFGSSSQLPLRMASVI